MFQTISMRQLEDMLNRERNFTLLDVREREKYEKGHLEGAVNMPLLELGTLLSMIPKEKPVIVYCTHGTQSLMAARQLSGLGYHVINASGGLNYYRGNHFVQKSFDSRSSSP